jgi:hypothetical protein
MDEKDFKKHFQDLARGHHHPEEHDWESADIGMPKVKEPAKVKRAGSAAKGSTSRKTKRRSKSA